MESLIENIITKLRQQINEDSLCGHNEYIYKYALLGAIEIIKKEELPAISEKATRTKEKSNEFKLLAKPLIKFLNDNYNPHCKIIIGSTSAEIVSGEMGF